MTNKDDMLPFGFLTCNYSIYTNLYNKLEKSEEDYLKVPLLIENKQELEDSLTFLEHISHELEIEKEIADVLERGYTIVPNRTFRSAVEHGLKSTLKLACMDKGVIQTIYNRVKDLFIVEELRDKAEVTYYTSAYTLGKIKRGESIDSAIINAGIYWKDSLSNVSDEVVIKQLMLFNNNGIGAGFSSSVLIGAGYEDACINFQLRNAVNTCVSRLGLVR